MAMVMNEVIKRIHDLPSLSAVVVELLTSMEDDDVDVHVLGEKISHDQALTAKTLRLANSSFYGMPSKVTTIHQAISVLGFHSIRTLVTACAISGSFPPGSGGLFDFKAFWRHSVATAVCAKLLAARFKLNPDTAFTAGLLHDIGTLVLATRFPAEYGQMLAHRRQHDCYIVDAEQVVFGLDHAATGSALAAYWKFPEPIQRAVAEHHSDTCAGPVSLQLVVHAANTVAHALDLSGQEDDLAPPMAEAVWQALAPGLDGDGWRQLFAQTESTCSEMCQILVN
ncbi:MAG: HDOD domain-containing protein [Telluria sp.]